MVRDVEATIEQRPPAGAGHGQLVDRGVSVALSLQCRVGDGVASVIIIIIFIIWRTESEKGGVSVTRQREEIISFKV